MVFLSLPHMSRLQFQKRFLFIQIFCPKNQNPMLKLIMGGIAAAVVMSKSFSDLDFW